MFGSFGKAAGIGIGLMTPGLVICLRQLHVPSEMGQCKLKVHIYYFIMGGYNFIAKLCPILLKIHILLDDSFSRNLSDNKNIYIYAYFL
jgi:hypothetical protein